MDPMSVPFLSEEMGFYWEENLSIDLNQPTLQDLFKILIYRLSNKNNQTSHTSSIFLLSD